MPPEFARSVDWYLDRFSRGVGLELTLEYSPFNGESEELDASNRETEAIRYLISFRFPLAWAYVELSRMLQYYPEHDCPPVLQEVAREDDHVFIREFSIHKETFGDEWRRFRVTIGDEVLEVVTSEEPEIRRL